MQQRITSFLSLSVLFLVVPAWGWGPATHAVIAMRVTGSSSPEIAFGAAVPDMNAIYQNDPDIKSAMKQLTHHEFDLLAPSFFSTGLATHNSDWGADYYAHLYYYPGEPEIFSTEVINQMTSEFGISKQDAEDIFEMTIDYLNRVEYGPELGVIIADGARTSGAAHEKLLVDGWALPLSQRVSGLSVEDSEAKIRQGLRSFCIVTQTFGELLQNDLDYIHANIVPLLAAYTGTDTATAEARFDRTIELCADYRSEMDRMAAEIGSIMAGQEAYQVPASDRGSRLLLALILGMCGMALLYGRKKSEASDTDKPSLPVK